MKNRSREEIVVEILSALKEPVVKTTIMYKSRLSYGQLKFYHKYLLEKRLIMEEGGRWLVTEKGKSYLKAYTAANRILNDPISR